MATTRKTPSRSRSTSRTPKTAVAPSGWNWGAFWLTWIWGLGNSVWISLLALIPGVGLIMAFVLGAKGNEWAWNARQDKNVARFKDTQRKWAIAGWIVGALTILALAAAIAAGVFAFKATAAPVDTTREYIADLQANRVNEAYAESSTLFKTVTTEDKLQAVAKTQQDLTTGEFKVTSRQIQNGGTATVQGTLKGKNGQDISVTARLVKEKDSWKVQNYVIR